VQIIAEGIEHCQDWRDDSPMSLLKPRGTYHHGNLEAALIATATKLVRVHGAEHLSLRAVAAELGVSPSALYHYYPDKDSLISGLGAALFESLADLQEKAISQYPGTSKKVARARYRSLGRAYFEWAKSEPHLFRLMFGGFCSIDFADALIKRRESRAWNLLCSCLEDLERHGLIDPKIRPYAEILSWSAVHGATALIVEGHLAEDSFESVLDGLELSLGIGKP
jgi:AcrR family transcriptional regulator